MNTSLLKNKTKNVIIKRFSGDIFLYDFVKYLPCLKDCIPNYNQVSLIIDIRKAELKFSITELSELVHQLNLEFLKYTKVSLILITATPKQAAYSYFVKHKVENPRREIVICSFYDTAKISMHKNTFLPS